MKGIIWDLDGTLYDPFEPALNSLKTCFKTAVNKRWIPPNKHQRLKRKINGEELYLYKFWKVFYEKDDSHIGKEDLPLKLVFEKAWFDDEIYMLQNFKAQVLEVLEKLWFKEFYGQLLPFHWVYKTLRELKNNGSHMGLISDSPVEFGQKKVSVLQLDEFFDPSNIIWTREEGYKKPERDSFLEMSSRFGLFPSEILVVGDIYDKDGKGARNAGMSFLPVNHEANFNYFLRQLWDVIYKQ